VAIRRVLPNGGFREEPCHRPIRVQDLFTMSSGYSYNLPPEAMGQRTNMPSTRAFADFLATIPLHFEPGSHWHYGFSHDILGALIEELAGKTFGEYLKENIFAPLGMEDTSFRIPKDKAPRLAACYEADLVNKQYKKMPEDDFFNADSAFESGGAGILSTIDDYAKFANALCNGGTATNGYRVLSRQTVELMRTNHLDETRMKDFADPANGWGYGLGVRCLLDRAAAGSNGHPGAFGWSGLAGTDCHIDPAAELVILYAQQMMPSLETYTHNRIRNIVYAAL
jgi:CubicO group peptidase (beta-lactamase class C family)